MGSEYFHTDYGERFLPDYPSEFREDGTLVKFCPRCGEMKPWKPSRINFCDDCVIELIEERRAAARAVAAEHGFPMVKDADLPQYMPVTGSNELPDDKSP